MAELITIVQSKQKCCTQTMAVSLQIRSPEAENMTTCQFYIIHPGPALNKSVTVHVMTYNVTKSELQWSKITPKTKDHTFKWLLI